MDGNQAIGIEKGDIARVGTALSRRGYSVISSFGGNLSVVATTPAALYGQPTQEISGITYQQQEMSPVAVPRIRLVHANYMSTSNVTADTALGEVPPLGPFSLSGCVVDLTNATSRLVKWGGQTEYNIGSWAVQESDDVPYAVPANTWYAVRSCAFPPTSDFLLPGVTGFGRTQGGVAVFSKSGSWPDEKTKGQQTGTGATGPAGGGYQHSLVLGYTGLTPTKTVAIWGDSNQIALGDAGCFSGGWAARLGLNNESLSVTEANTAAVAYAFGNFSKQGESLRGFATDVQHQTRLLLAQYFTNVICTLGANDIVAGVGLANMQAATLKLALECSKRSVKFIMCSLPPVLAGLPTNGGVYAADLSTVQTKSGNDATRVSFNAWLRDATAAGYLAQAVAAGCGLTYLGFYDAASFLEVNASNVLTLGGGYMLTPANGATPLYTGSVTTGGSAAQVTDSASSAVVNTYRGCTLVPTSGANAGQAASVTGNTAGKVIGFNKSFGSNFTAGDAFQLWGTGGVNLVDNVHLTASAQILLKQNFPTSLLI